MMSKLLHILFFLLLPIFSFAQTSYNLDSERNKFQQAIIKYQTLVDANNWHTFPAKLVLRPGDSSQFVPLLQENLVLTGDLALDSATTANLYTSAIKNAISNFQTRHGLDIDGIVGPNTVKALNVPISHRLYQLKLNFRRLDSTIFLAKQPYIIINLPEYDLKVIKNDTVVEQMRIIIGKPEFNTFPVTSKVDMVVFRPNWYVPRSIAVNEILPILRRNPEYLASKNMQLQQQTLLGWMPLKTSHINWHEVNDSNFNYRIVQLSGPDNELGIVKFPFPNKIAQYMHDTPHKALFDKSKRAFSHGCIRLERPMELAYFVLENGSGFSAKKIDRIWDREKPNHYIRVKDPLPLFITYKTAWVANDLKVHFREDIYNMDKQLQLSKE
jgi:L,D-transpeptidase YcbB